KVLEEIGSTATRRRLLIAQTTRRVVTGRYGALECCPALDNDAVIGMDCAVDNVGSSELDIPATARAPRVRIVVAGTTRIERVNGLVVGEVDIVDEAALLELCVE